MSNKEHKEQEMEKDIPNQEVENGQGSVDPCGSDPPGQPGSGPGRDRGDPPVPSHQAVAPVGPDRHGRHRRGHGDFQAGPTRGAGARSHSAVHSAAGRPTHS